MSATKAEFKKTLKDMPYDELLKLYNELKLEKIKNAFYWSQVLKTEAANPKKDAHKGKDPKILNWKYVQVMNLLHSKVKLEA